MVSYAEWAASQRSVEVEVDGHDVEVAYYDEGEGDPVVFLHGIPSNSYLFQKVIGPVEAERRVVVPDMIGYGNSSMYDGFDRSLRAQEVMLERLFEALDLGSIDYVGHDIGAAIGVRYAVHNPERVGRFVLSQGSLYDSWPVDFMMDLGLPTIPREKSVEEMQEVVEGIFRAMVKEPASDEFMEGMLEPWNSEEGVVSLVRNCSALNTNHTTEVDHSAIQADTLCLWGVDDDGNTTIELAERLAADVATCEVRGIAGGHWITEDNPEGYREGLAEFILD